MREKSITDELHFSNIGELWLYIMSVNIVTIFANILLPVGWFIKFSETTSIDTYITMWIIIDIGLLLITIWVIYVFLPIVRVGFFVSKDYFKFDLQRKFFLKVFWRDVEVVEAIKTSWSCYKINYVKLYQPFTLRLYLFSLTKKKQKQILYLLKQHANTVGVNFKEGKKESDDYKEAVKDYKEIKAIIKKSNKWSSLFKVFVAA